MKFIIIIIIIVFEIWIIRNHERTFPNWNMWIVDWNENLLCIVYRLLLFVIFFISTWNAWNKNL